MKTVKIEIKCLNYKGLVERLASLMDDIELFHNILKENGMNLKDTIENSEGYSLSCDPLEENENEN